MTHTRAPVTILISGRGSNLQASVDARLPIEIRAVISKNANAPGLAIATRAGLPVEVIDHRQFPDRTAFDRALGDCIARYAPTWVLLAGFMRILGGEFIDRFAGRLINIHPSLLPQFPGLNTHARALAAGVAEHGATVHFVTHEVDGGPIIAQARVQVEPGDDAARLAARVLAAEHALYPEALRALLNGAVRLENGRVITQARAHA